MSKTLLIYGVLSGVIISGSMLIGMSMMSNSGAESSMVIGYAMMLIPLSLIFFGIKAYRNKDLGGNIKFGKAFLAGLVITLIMTIFYIGTWEIYFSNNPDVMNDYFNADIEKVKNSGLSQEKIEETIKIKTEQKENYQTNSGFRMLMTFTEIFPFGLLITLISALILKKKKAIE